MQKRTSPGEFMTSAMEPSGTHLRRDGRREVAANNSAGNSVPFDRDRRLTLANPERMALNTVSESGFRWEQVVLRTVDTVSLPRIVVPASSGAPKEMERRLAAIVCADVAGYSRM